MLSPRLMTTQEILDLPPTRWLIDSVLGEGSFALLYGPPGIGKTFLALDLALSISTGQPWQQHPVGGGTMVYVLAEGTGGLKNRLEAWQQTHHPITNAWWYPHAVNFRLELDTRDFLTCLSPIPRPTLIVIDTLARCFLGGDESAAEDMTRFITNIDHLRMVTGATILAVHHSTKADVTRERGSSALMGSVDTAISCTRVAPGVLRMTCQKQRDGEMFEPILLGTLKVPLRSGRSSLILSALVGEGEVQEGEGGDEKVWDKLLARFERTGSLDGWEADCSRSSYFRVKKRLEQAGKIPKVH